ncbi:19195_t:CDS:1, partial [Cetraspora pellucida]
SWIIRRADALYKNNIMTLYLGDDSIFNGLRSDALCENTTLTSYFQCNNNITTIIK